MIPFELDVLKRAALYSFTNEKELVDSILEVKEIFTTSRHRIKEYIQSPRLISAYALYYLPTNFSKFSFLTGQLPESILAEWSQCHFIDVGTGPGTYILAFLDFAGLEHRGQVLGLDHSPLMLEQAQKCLVEYFPDLVGQGRVNFSTSGRPVWDRWDLDRPTILFFGHSVNEMGPKKAMELITQVRPSYVVFLEPGTKESFQGLLQLRGLMAALGVNPEKGVTSGPFEILYPCARLDFSCPLEQKLKSGEEDWCHQKMHQTLPDEWARLGQLLSMDRHVMPMIAHVYALKKKKSQVTVVEKNQDILTPLRGRLFRFIRETKYSLEWEVCLEKGDKLELIHCEALKKEHEKISFKALKRMTPGMTLYFCIVKCFPSGTHRIRLLSS